MARPPKTVYGVAARPARSRSVSRTEKEDSQKRNREKKIKIFSSSLVCYWGCRRGGIEYCYEAVGGVLILGTFL